MRTYSSRKSFSPFGGAVFSPGFLGQGDFGTQGKGSEGAVCRVRCVCSALPGLRTEGSSAKAPLPGTASLLSQLQVGRALAPGLERRTLFWPAPGLSVFHYSSLCLCSSLGSPRPAGASEWRPTATLGRLQGLPVSSRRQAEDPGPGGPCTGLSRSQSAIVRVGLRETNDFEISKSTASYFYPRKGWNAFIFHLGKQTLRDHCAAESISICPGIQAFAREAFERAGLRKDEVENTRPSGPTWPSQDGGLLGLAQNLWLVWPPSPRALLLPMPEHWRCFFLCPHPTDPPSSSRAASLTQALSLQWGATQDYRVHFFWSRGLVGECTLQGSHRIRHGLWKDFDSYFFSLWK